jgi:23S rRNA (guanosine2251-2'-O)-methyltransferase
MTLIMGIHAVEELFKYAPQKLLRLYTAKSSDLSRECERRGIPVSIVPIKTLSQMVQSDSHQSVVAEIKDRRYFDVRGFLDEHPDAPLILMLDQIFDPQNFGALIRSAECFGASAVVWSKNRGSDLTPVAVKASCGASELLPLIRLSNLATGVDQFQEAGFEVVAALLDPKAESAYTFRYAPQTLLIVGSEGEGIQPLLRKKANRSIYLPMKGKIGSLNVAQAASALLALRASQIRD